MGNSPNTGSQEVNVPARSTKPGNLQPEARAKFENWLKNFPLSLKPQQTQAVLNASRFLNIESSQVVLRKGKNAVGIFVVLSGKFEVVGDELLLEKSVFREVVEDDCFGEVSVMYDTQCTATVRATTR